ncbi:MAG TPA: energy-coupling factor transporter transmembrane protein EcfT [Acidimicrobiia bacterium]|jgi:energy-coupling factor transporter transmembrane protein EcfT
MIDESRAVPGTKHREPEITFLRLVPGSSPVHRLWAGTKLIVVGIVSLVASLRPTWLTLIALAVVVVGGFVVGRVPPSALPRLPRWFFAFLLLGAALSLRSSAAPLVDVLGVKLSLGGLSDWARLTLLTAELVLVAGLVGWTTPLGEIAPALTRLVRPIRWTRLPVDEWITAVALSIRSLPLLVTESRTLLAARRLRRVPSSRRSRASLKRGAHEFNGLVIAAIRVAIRHAEDVGDAMEARGGAPNFDDPTSRMGHADAIVVVTAALLAAALLVA